MTSEGSNTTAITLRKPTKDDGYRLHQLVAECPPLDPNSIYCNLLQCSHFAETGVAAEKGGDLVGFISGYIPPQQPETVFVWQVAVHEKGRGQGLAKRRFSSDTGTVMDEPGLYVGDQQGRSFLSLGKAILRIKATKFRLNPIKGTVNLTP